MIIFRGPTVNDSSSVNVTTSGAALQVSSPSLSARLNVHLQLPVTGERFYQALTDHGAFVVGVVEPWATRI